MANIKEGWIAYYEQRIAELNAQSANTDEKIAKNKQKMAELDAKIAALKATLPDSAVSDSELLPSGSRLSSGGIYIDNDTDKKTVLTGTDYGDYLLNPSSINNVTISAGNGDDEVFNYGKYASVNGDSDDDRIYNGGSYSTVYGGTGDDSIVNGNSNTTINAGAGDDTINMSSSTGYSNNVIIYTAGDGDDIIYNFGAKGYSGTNTLSIAGDNYSTAMSGSNMIVTVGKGQITLVPGSSGDFPSIVGTYGSSTVQAAATATTTSGGSSTSTTSSGSSTSTTTSGGSSTSTIASPATNTVSSSETNNENISLTPQVRIYAGGDQVISDYQSGEQIILGTMPTSWIFGDGNFALGSATGNLFITNANDKVIDFVDGAGNSFLKAYAATNAGIIDGRGLAGYEYIVGSDAGTDIIFAGDGGSQLWGGNGVDSDVLVGGGGADMFIGGKYQGSDTFMNAGTTDMLFLNDAILSDLVFAGETDSGTVVLAFNTGNVIAVQSSEALSAAVVLADGSAYRFNHATRNWQSA